MLLTKDKLFSSRMLIAVLVLAIFHDSGIKELAEFGAEFDLGVSPFLLSFLFGKLTFCIIFGFCVMYVFSGTPYMNSRELYFIARAGRKKWCMAQQISIFLASIGFVIINFLIDIIRLFPHVSFEDNWDRISFTVAYGTMGQNTAVLDISVMDKYSPYELAIYSFVIGVLVVNLIGQLMYAVSLITNRTVAVLLGGIIAIMPIIARSTARMYSLVYFLSPISWISRTRDLWAIKLPDEKFMCIAAILVWFVCAVMSLIRVNVVEFEWREEE